QGRHAGSGSAQSPQNGPDYRARRRKRDRCGETHETQVRIAGGRPGGTGRAFLDIRKRVVQFPTGKINRVRMIAIPTTSGTGSEVTRWECGQRVGRAGWSG